MSYCPNCGKVHASVGAPHVAQDSPYRSQTQRLYAATLKGGLRPLDGLLTPEVKEASAFAHMGAPRPFAGLVTPEVKAASSLAHMGAPQPFAGLVTPEVKAASALAHMGAPRPFAGLITPEVKAASSLASVGSSASIAARNIAAHRAAAIARYEGLVPLPLPAIARASVETHGPTPTVEPYAERAFARQLVNHAAKLLPR